MSLRSLKSDALAAAVARGHAMTRFSSRLPRRAAEPHEAFAYCTRCGRGATVDTRPPPNGAAITGEAVALNCCP